jgi:hypothetical protein
MLICVMRQQRAASVLAVRHQHCPRWRQGKLSVVHRRAFGTGVPEIVTIGEFPDTSWLVVTGNILLVVHSAINYQVYARLTLEVGSLARCSGHVLGMCMWWKHGFHERGCQACGAARSRQHQMVVARLDWDLSVCVPCHCR